MSQTPPLPNPSESEIALREAERDLDEGATLFTRWRQFWCPHVNGPLLGRCFDCGKRWERCR